MIHIYIETENKPTNEWRFIEHLVHLQQGNLQNITIHGTAGYTNLSKYREKMKEYGAMGEKIAVIFDADCTLNEGGFAQRRSYISEEMEKVGVDCQVFLFPNNNDDGIFEDLLEKIVTEEHQGVLKCFDQYQKCIKDKNRPNDYKVPIQKSKMYAYIDTMKGSTTKQIREGDWSFDRKEYWNFDVDYLTPLKEFITELLSSNTP